MTGGRILVVEDNALNLKLIRDVLQVGGYDVVEARSGEEGVHLAHDCSPDLVLMDLQLPGIDGVEALHQIRQDPVVGDVPVVAVTAFAMEEDRERAYADGFDGYLSKPISVRALPSQVDAFLVRGHPHG
ncbi:response regulator [Cellulomonas sp. Leaf395]|uniref:response regulator n=1 Tax=Cellulomonas sp. Leaf395 TaxID=1736362 RepID=UPI0006FB1C40|nr:response regulator [Cellulomonas sp. Leaf395]KQS97023.1 two-component system response regulator [Cellulomonas sp. Leaf395]